MSWWKSAGDLFNIDKASDLVEKARAVAKDAADAATRLSETVQEEYRRTFEDLDCQIVRVRPELAVMEFPSDDTINRLSTRLNSECPDQMLIYNLSEHRYDASKFKGEVVDISFESLGVLSLEKLVDLCLKAHHWLVSNPDNVFIVHCLKGYLASAAFLGCLMVLRGLHEDPASAVGEIFEALDLGSATAKLAPAQLRYLAYFRQCQQDFSPAPTKLRLVQVSLSSVPCFEQEGSVAFRPCIEVWNSGERICTSSQENPPPTDGFGAFDTSATLQLPPEVVVAGDTLVRVQHVFPEGKKRVLAFSFVFHTAFATEGLRLTKSELDGACDDSRFEGDFVLELSVQAVDGSAAPPVAMPIFSEARNASTIFKAEERRKQAAADEAGKPDEGDELERTLGRGSAVPEGGATHAAGSTSSPSAALASASATEDAAELRRALAAAAADEDGAGGAASEAAKPTPTLGAEPADSTPGAAGGGDAGLAPASGAVKEPAAQDPVKGSADEIDELFGQFGAALEAVASSGGTSAAGTGSTGKSPTTLAERTTDTGGSSLDPFGEADAFLKELESA